MTNKFPGLTVRVRRGSNLTLTHKQPSIHHLAG